MTAAAFTAGLAVATALAVAVVMPAVSRSRAGAASLLARGAGTSAFHQYVVVSAGVDVGKNAAAKRRDGLADAVIAH
jgi:hypothetical protein